MEKKDLAKMIDQTLLSPGVGERQVEDFCRKARDYGFASVCINPCFVKMASNILDGADTKVCTVIDFPLGSGGLESKIRQAQIAMDDGAQELDFVIDLSLVKSHLWVELKNQLQEIAGHKLSGVIYKLILETCVLTDEEIVQSCKCAKDGGFDFVKTSTGFYIAKDENGNLLPNGATLHAVELMRKTVGKTMGVKASGGIRNSGQALEMVLAGASRIGTSSGCQIVDGL